MENTTPVFQSSYMLYFTTPSLVLKKSLGTIYMCYTLIDEGLLEIFLERVII